MRHLELLGVLVCIGVAYAATGVAWLLGWHLNLALALGCFVFAGLLGLAEAGLALWSIVQRWADGERPATVAAAAQRDAQRARALHIVEIQRATRPSGRPPA